MKRFWRRPIVRLTLAGLASLAIFLFAVLLLLLRPVFGTAMATAIEMSAGISQKHRDECRRAPESFHLVVGLGVELWSVPEDLSRSLNPQAPEIPNRLKAQLTLQQEKPAVLFVHPSEGGHGGASLLKGTPGTDCAWMLATWPYQPENRERLEMYALVTVLVGTLGAFFLYGWIALFPLYRRLRKLAEAAELVGTPKWARPDEEGDAFGRLADVLEHSHERLIAEKAADARARRFLEEHLSAVAHDLRTPLTAIQLALEETRRHIGDGRDPQEALLAAEADTAYLVLLTENLRLATSLGEGAKPGATLFRLDEVASRVSTRFERLGRQRNIEVVNATGDVEVLVHGNAVLAEQAIANIVHNAVSHHDSEGHVAVVLEVRDEGFCLEVSDDGPGFEPAEALTIQSEDASLLKRIPDAGGHSGLGLKIVALCCAELGWKLQVLPVNPRGTRLILSGKRGK